jgi:hypothetical protein
MRKMSLFTPAFASVAALFAGLASSAANATIYSYDVTVWTGTPDGAQSSTIADAAHTPAGDASAHFTYTGPINWVNNEAQNYNTSGNLAKNFLSIADITSFNSPNGAYADATAFGNASLSVAGDSHASFFQITGSYSSLGPIGDTIKHDDGASIYVDGVAVYSHASETSVLTSAFGLPAGQHSYLVDYVEGNGAPAVLSFTTSVPELSTWAMMIIGFGGVALQMRRRDRAIAMTA